MKRAVATVPLGSVTTWLSGGTPDRSNTAYWTGPIPWISAATLRTARIDDSDQRVTEAAVRAGSKMAPRGATLVLVRGMALHREVRAGLATRPLSFNQDVKALVPRPPVMPEFLTYALHARRSKILKLVSLAGSGTGVLDTNLLKRLPIWLPDLREQALIVEAIDDIESTVDSLERLVTKKQAIKQGMMQQLLTGKTRLPGFEAPWHIRSIGDAAVVLDNLRVPLSAEQRVGRAGPYPYCGANGVLDFIDDFMIDDDVILLAEDGGNFDQFQSRPIAYRMMGRIWVNNHAHVLKAAAGGDTAFLFYALERRDITPFISSGTRSKLTRGELVRITVDLPSDVDEQRAIGIALEDADRELTALHSRLTKAKAIKQGMMQELLTGRTRLPVREGVE